MTTPEDLEKYVQVMRSLGVQAFESGSLKIVLGAAPAQPLPPRDPNAPTATPRRTDYDRLLFACTEGLDEDDQDAG